MALVVNKIKNNSLINNINPKETQFILQLKFPFPYNKMYNIIKNIQTFGNLISFFENKINIINLWVHVVEKLFKIT